MLTGVPEVLPQWTDDIGPLEAQTPVAPAPVQAASLTQQLVGSQFDASETRRELVIIDEATPDYQLLLADILAGGQAGRQIEALVIDSSRDGVELISQILQSYTDLDAIHIISHGTGGSVQLGNTLLNSSNLDTYATAIEGWSGSLSEDADLLFYGCELAANEAGRQLTGSLSELTGADVAASRDVTGHALLGGNWDLEFSTGPIEASTAFSTQVQAAWQGTLAVEDFDAGSYVIDMGQATQTINNSIKPYGLIYDLTMNNQVPVKWAINPNKDYNFETQGANTPAEPVDPIGNTADFSADIYDEITYFPKTVFNDQNEGLEGRPDRDLRSDGAQRLLRRVSDPTRGTEHQLDNTRTAAIPGLCDRRCGRRVDGRPYGQ